MTKTKTSNRSQSFESRSFSNVLRRPTSDSHASDMHRSPRQIYLRIFPISLGERRWLHCLGQICQSQVNT
jgi:hypothetical protein